MKAIYVFAILWALAYLGCTWAFVAAIGAPVDGWIAVTWLLFGQVVLGALAYELASVVLFLSCRCLGVRLAHDMVPRSLTAEQLADLEKRAPRTAVIIPAHGELRTPKDRYCFLQRIVRIVANTPSWCVVWFIFDTEAAEAAQERKFIETAKDELARRLGPHQAERLRFAEYRDKPPEMQNKPGTVKLFLRDHPELQYVFSLDADSEIGLESTARRPEAQHVVERAVWAAMGIPNFGFLQGLLVIQHYQSIWGWMQCIGSQFSLCYTSPLYELLFGRVSPCYGHGCLYDAHVLYEHCDLLYLSHDHKEAASIAAAGYQCIYTTAILTYEAGEDSYLTYCSRSLRWSRGNVQWPSYLFKRWSALPAEAKMYLWLGVLNYAYPLATTLFTLLTAVLIAQGIPVFRSIDDPAAATFLALTLASLLGPKVLLMRPFSAVVGYFLIGFLMSPAQMFLEGLMFLVAPYGKKWTFRSSRNPDWNSGHVLQILGLTAPVSITGVLMMTLLSDVSPRGVGESCYMAMVSLFLAAPAVAVAVSTPMTGDASPTP